MTHDGLSRILGVLRPDLKATELTREIPDLRPTKANRADYDPGFWKETIQYRKFANTEATLHGLRFMAMLAFHKSVLHSFHLFGRTRAVPEDYEKARAAYESLREFATGLLGQPEREQALLSYEKFVALVPPTDGRPDEQYVEAGGSSWRGAHLALSGGPSGELSLELRWENS